MNYRHLDLLKCIHHLLHVTLVLHTMLYTVQLNRFQTLKQTLKRSRLRVKKSLQACQPT